MEPVTAIIGAIAAGAAAAAKDTASQAVKDAYSGLKTLIQKWFSEKKDAKGELALAEYTEDSDTWEKPLVKALTETGAHKSTEIITAVENLRKALKDIPGGPDVLAKYNIKNSKVGIIGDGTIIEGDLNMGGKG